jgi:hypothetical protein
MTKTLCLTLFFSFVWIFQSPRKLRLPSLNYGPQGKTVPACILHSLGTSKDLEWFLGLKDLTCGTELVFYQAIAQVPIVADIAIGVGYKDFKR